MEDLTVAWALRALLPLADPRVARQQQTYFKETRVVLGVTTDDTRRVAYALAARIDAGWAPGRVLVALEPFVRDRRDEVKSVGLLACEKLWPRLDAALLARARRWFLADWCDSWAAVDALCIGAIGPLLVARPALAPRVLPWARSRNLWLRRAGVVALVKPVRKALLLDEAYAVAAGLLGDGEDLMHKATGWMLREAGKPDMRRLERFLLEHGPRIPRTALRYAIERFPERERRRILAATRG